MGSDTIERVIDPVALDRSGTLVVAETTLRALKSLDAETLQLAAHWADLHDPASLPPPQDTFEERRRRLNGDHGVRLGGEGTPEVLASCLAELGTVLETSSGGARHLVADALDLRHRLPRLWAEVVAGRVRAWKARQVASATRTLPASAMDEVDAGLADLLATLPWSRFATVLEATVKRAGPYEARAAEEQAATRRFVGVGRANDHGITTLIARGTTLDVQTFLAAVKRIAEILEAEGDPDPVDVRRSKAVGILGQPARALALLTGHREDRDPRGSEPTKTEPGGPDEPAEPGDRSLDLTGLTGADPAALAALTTAGPRVQLYVHLTDAALAGTDPRAIARVEGVGPITVSTVRAWLRRPDVSVTIRPVVVPGETVPVDAYEIPTSTREAVRLRSPASAFPWSACTARTMDLDHVAPYVPPARGGPPGQTRPAGLAPLARSEHGVKTSGRWQTRSPAPGVQLWRTPHGWIHLVTNQGTFPLGRGATARALWRAVAAPGSPARPVLGARTRSLVESYLHDLTRHDPRATASRLTR